MGRGGEERCSDEGEGKKGIGQKVWFGRKGSIDSMHFKGKIRSARVKIKNFVVKGVAY